MVRLLLLLLVCFVLPAHAAENEISLGGTLAGRYDSNVNNSEYNEISSGGIEVGPRLKMRSTANEWSAGLFYKPVYIWNSASSVENEWRQFLNVDGSWQITPNTSMVAYDRLRYENNATRSEFDTGGTTVPVSDFTDQYELVNVARLTVNHQFDERTLMSSEFTHTLINSESQNRSDSQTIVGAINANHALSPKLRLGGGFRTSYVSVENDPSNPISQITTGSTSTYITGFGSMRYLFTPHFSFEFNVGPTYIITEVVRPQNPNPLFPPAVDPGDEWTWFALGGLAWNSDRWTTSLNYKRSEDANPRSSLTQTSDTVNFRSEWRPLRDWVFAGRAAWVKRDSVGSDSLARSSDLEQWLAAVTGSWRFHPSFTAHMTVDYLHQNDDRQLGTVFTNIESDRVRFWIRIDWDGYEFRF